MSFKDNEELEGKLSIGVISGIGGDFDIMIDTLFIGKSPWCAILTIHMLPNEITSIPTTTRNCPIAQQGTMNPAHVLLHHSKTR